MRVTCPRRWKGWGWCSWLSASSACWEQRGRGIDAEPATEFRRSAPLAGIPNDTFLEGGTPLGLTNLHRSPALAPRYPAEPAVRGRSATEPACTRDPAFKQRARLIIKEDREMLERLAR